MPTLPSGRRVEFSLDRFHSFLDRLDAGAVRRIVGGLREPDDLLFVLDAVHFRQDDGNPYFADYVAADWRVRAADWSTADRQTLQAWLDSPAARQARAEAVDYLHGLYRDEAQWNVPLDFPYVMADSRHQMALLPVASLMQ